MYGATLIKVAHIRICRIIILYTHLETQKDKIDVARFHCALHIFFLLVHIVWITFLWHLTKYCSLFLSPSPHILFLLVLVDTSVKLKTIVHLFTFAYSLNYLASNQWFTFHKKIIVHLFTLAICFIFLASNQWITTWHITCQGWHWPAWHKFSHIWFSLEKL